MQAKTSSLLEEIRTRKNRTANLKVVFVDVSAYSKRRSNIQAAVIDALTNVLKSALVDTAHNYPDYAENNKISFDTDVIVLPTGDGAAICFPFDGLHDVHLVFARCLLQGVHAHNQGSVCGIFDAQGWCDCHPAFRITVGISEGKGIIYQDINGGYNVAGNAINFAARVMGLAGPSQIVLSEEAYRELVDLADDAELAGRFREYKGLRVKHDVMLNVFQLVDESLLFLNSSPLKAQFQETSSELKPAIGKRFGVQQVRLDGTSFENCEFHGTELLFGGTQGFGLSKCSLSGTKFNFDGAAAATMMMLTRLHADTAFRPMVEQILNNVRKGVLPEAVPPFAAPSNQS